ncbi:MAG TPA: 2-oxo acid dehydrogenase subunit E2 [Chloroflexi bacterium]|nr:2-oxo acid dehydrogenase subunit E2 [Chloroflexota bacterium]
MPTKITMPKLGESVVEGTINKWLVQEGDKVDQYDPILEITTDKVDAEIPCSTNGTILKLLVSEGDTVKVGSLLGWIGEPNEAIDIQPTDNLQTSHLTETVDSPSSTKSISQETYISPVVKKIISENNLDITQIKGTGQDGRITKKDVQTFMRTKNHSAAIGHSSVRLSMTPMRKTIAQHMIQSKHTSAHVTTVFEVDMTNVIAHRKTNQTSYADNDIKLTYTAYFLYACALALSSHKTLNSTLVDDMILIKDDINIGFAVSLGEGGLIVPVIRETDKKTLSKLAHELNDLTTRARAHTLRPDEVQHGTFTITNHGVFGSVVATAIINQPQCAILGIGAIQKRVVVIEDIMEIRPMVYISLTFDHRIIDGEYADEFLKKVKTELEQWT